ncbi:DUF998 domain-containing protein [Streptomyces solicathayae]|uniref:DUF998 domain-containing protein n=1 Tax=Streptomyces solicathayae TaxID=3081768 RepID=A0ABZ0LZ54_9ACTN|nr:DUF998 domain-containing protein [Streptomyces sp. HUAS YS2]WOX24723.1 DUF998 domain-containing protein [Streptomyces sp. HUAS YS2]
MSRTPRIGAPRAAVTLLLLGALAYSAWLTEVFVRTGLDPVRTYVSELAATDQPYGTLFRTTDLVAGLLLLAGSCWALLRTERRLWAVVGWAGLALFGASTVADSRLPLSCTPTADAACAAREAAGLVPLTHTAHATSSALAMVGALVGMVALTVAARRYRDRPPLARTGAVLVVVGLAATGWTLGAIAAFEAGNGTWGLGAAQRVQLLCVVAWIVVLAVAERRAAAPAAPAERPRAGAAR